MRVRTDCSWLDERTDLNNVVGTIMMNQQPSSCMIEHAMLSENDEIIRLNSDILTSMKLVVVSSPILHVLTYANNLSRFTKLYTIC